MSTASDAARSGRADPADGGRDATRYRRNAVIAGVLIVAGYLAYGVPSGAVIQPLLDASDPLDAVAANATRLTAAALVMAVNSAAVVGIGLALYPVLRRHDETIALGYLATRLFESILMVGGIVGLLLLVPLSGANVQPGTADPSSLDALATLAVAGNDYAYNVAMLGLGVGSLPFCYLLYRSRLVPRSIAVLGLVGYPALVALMVLELIGGGVAPTLYVLYLPGAAFELGLALWLIARGFATPATNRERPGISGS